MYKQEDQQIRQHCIRVGTLIKCHTFLTFLILSKHFGLKIAELLKFSMSIRKRENRFRKHKTNKNQNPFKILKENINRKLHVYLT